MYQKYQCLLYNQMTKPRLFNVKKEVEVQEKFWNKECAAQQNTVY